MIQTETRKTEQIQLLDLIVLVLSLYVLGAMIVNHLYALPYEVSHLINYIDSFICGIFFIDFLVRFYKADNKIKFMKWGWIDLISAIPVIDVYRVARISRILQIIRIIKTFRTSKRFLNHVYAKKTQGTFASVATVVILLIIFSAIGILEVETHPNSNIKTAEDAMWWAYVTVTTVGYGDKFPVTTEGRIIAAVLMTAGVSMFGAFTAYVSSWFVSNKQDSDQK